MKEVILNLTDLNQIQDSHEVAQYFAANRDDGLNYICVRANLSDGNYWQVMARYITLSGLLMQIDIVFLSKNGIEIIGAITQCFTEYLENNYLSFF